jgi:hypothetical protein
MKARYFAIAASVLMVAACGGNNAETEAAADSAAMTAPAPVETPAMDSTAMAAPADSAAMAAPMDSTATTTTTTTTTDTAAHQ